MKLEFEVNEKIASRLIRLKRDFFLKDSVSVARSLVGCWLITKKEGIVTGGKIVETEAYPASDPASHIYGLTQKTPRTEIQFREGGCLYIYLIMGLHVMTSIVTNKKDVADVVFIRSLEPLIGIEEMKKRRNYYGDDLRKLTAGPGRLSEALGIVLQDQGKDLFAPDSEIEILKDKMFDGQVEAGKRINLGLSKVSESEAQISVNQPWRFFLKDSLFLS